MTQPDFTFGSQVISIVTDANDYTVADVTSWWLKDPQDSSKNMKIELEPGDLTGDLGDDRQNIVTLLGRPDPVVLSDTIGLPSYTLNVILRTEAVYQQFNQIRAPQRTLLLQGPHPWGQAYIRLGQQISDANNLAALRGRSATGQTIHKLQVPVQVVAAP